jgi:HprK-related kinase A
MSRQRPCDVRHAIHLCVGPRSFRVGSHWRGPVAALQALYAPYPEAGGIPHFTVRLEAERWWRRFIRPSIRVDGDYMLPDAAPLSLEHGLIAAEMAINLQMALGERHFLLLHAATVERDGKVLILTGESGSGKSTLSALLMAQGWRFMGDEFALIDPATGLAHPFPRPVSLKNESVAVVEEAITNGHWGPWQRGTAKGDLRHLVPDARAIAAMREPARPALLLFPAFGPPREVRQVGMGEVFVRLTQASTNYTALGEAGFGALGGLVNTVPAFAIDYPDTATALALVDELWRAHI